MRDILIKYLDQEIGINYERPFKIESAKLVAVDEEHFSIIDHSKEYTHHFSYMSVVQIIENADGVDISAMFAHDKHFEVVVKVGHIFEYIPA